MTKPQPKVHKNRFKKFIFDLFISQLDTYMIIDFFEEMKGRNVQSGYDAFLYNVFQQEIYKTDEYSKVEQELVEYENQSDYDPSEDDYDYMRDCK